MQKLGALALVLLMAMNASAQDDAWDGKAFEPQAGKGILDHMDVGVNVGTTGIGISVAAPVGKYVRVRAGYDYMPRISLKSDFRIETRNGSVKDLISKIDKIDEKIASYGLDINDPAFEDYKKMLDQFRSMEQKDYVTLNLKPTLHQFKFLVDVMPFRKNKHWSLTAGFFVGPSEIGEAHNLSKDELYLEGVNTYNSIYVDYCINQGIGPNGNMLQSNGPRSDVFYRYGMAGFNLGTFADGKRAMMVPSDDNTAQAVMKVNSFRPYFGLGYNTHLSRNRRWNMNVDAGVLFLFGSPSVYVDNVYKIDMSADLRFDEDGNYLSGMGFDADDNYYGDIVRCNPKTLEYEFVGEKLDHVDMIHDLKDVPGKVGDMVDLVSMLKVYPNLSVTFSYRLF